MTKPAENHLIVMTRLPCEGRNKTRLIPALGPAGAAEFHDRLARHAIGRASSYVLTNAGTKLVIRMDGGSPRQGEDWLGECDCRVQGPGDLGARMKRAADDAFAEGAKRVVIIGTDCPSIDEPLLAEAFDSLWRDDLVFGPALDGGYYLIGLTGKCDPVFENIHWGTSDVLVQSLAAARAVGVHAVLLGALPDVDLPEDLPAARTSLDQGASVSVIIPTFNEEGCIGKLLALLKSASPLEIIVADGGSTDSTVGMAQAGGARVIACPLGRAAQMNLAAAAATGEYILFLHADTLPPAGFSSIIMSLLQKPGVSAGAFRFRLDEKLALAPLIESLVNIRGIPYGDQGLFVRRRIFRHLGGFPDWPVMEDLHLVRSLRKIGRVHTSEAPVLTSSRRWETKGVVRTFIRHQLMLVAYHLGVPPQRIAKLRVYTSRQDIL